MHNGNPSSQKKMFQLLKNDLQQFMQPLKK